MMKLSPTSTRVQHHTPDDLNQQICRRMEEHVAGYTKAGTADIDVRLAELDREWDMERTLEANAAALALAGVVLGVFIDRKWFVLSAAVTGFLLQHALQGWCPPVTFFRRRGVRTETEINEERYALKALRGDFGELPGLIDERDHAAVGRLLEAIRR